MLPIFPSLADEHGGTFAVPVLVARARGDVSRAVGISHFVPMDARVAEP